jgi:predicted MPP superfamily phosphohydrolase
VTKEASATFAEREARCPGAQRPALAARPRSGGAWRGRRAAAAALLAAGALALYAGELEPSWVERTHHVLGPPRADGRPLRIVQLSDLHLSSVGARERRVAAQVRRERAELVVLTGDLVEAEAALPLLDAFLSLLGEPPAIVAVPGNRERSGAVRLASLRAVLARHHGRLLVNEVLPGIQADRRFAIAGLDYPAGRLAPVDAAAFARSPNRLILAHSPAARDAWQGPPAVAMLAGHTHGGQVAPFGLAPWLPPDAAGYRAGWYRGGAVDVYVSRGVGTSMLPLRLGARPEVTVFDWWLE